MSRALAPAELFDVQDRVALASGYFETDINRDYLRSDGGQSAML